MRRKSIFTPGLFTVLTAAAFSFLLANCTTDATIDVENISEVSAKDKTATANSGVKYGINEATYQWILENNPALPADFITSSLPETPIKLPNGKTLPLYQLSQFLDYNFRFKYVVVGASTAATEKINATTLKLRKIYATPEFRAWIYSNAPFCKGTKRGAASAVYANYRGFNSQIKIRLQKNIGATACTDGRDIITKSWANATVTYVISHETSHILGYNHESGLNYKASGKGGLDKWIENNNKLGAYTLVDANSL
jgi:hypothetical protein